VAQLALRIAENVEGDWFVDSSCIDCDACRQIAPSVFHDAGGQSAVHHQPDDDEELLAAQKALIACPTASIGTASRHDLTRAVASYPELIAGDVYRCGYTAESSFGAFSYSIASSRTLIDSPRFALPLVRNLEKLGGVRRMLLTHRDDVADHEKFASHFGCERVLHRDDVGAHTASVERQPEGSEPVVLDEDVVMIPTPGHTRGHAVFLYRDEFLFTGAISRGTRSEGSSTRSARPAGTRGPSRSVRWSVCSTSASSGCSPGTGGRCTSRRKRCTRRWRNASPG
jgi:ferredoxin